MSDDTHQITYFAETDARNKKVRFGIKTKDRLRHLYVIGKTGVGKSTLLENMAIQDIQNGEGLAFIDPHGGTAEKLLDYIPEHRLKDVLYFAPFDMEYPISFNVLEDIGVDKRHLVVNGLMSTFEKIWVDAWSARMAYILNNTLLALLEYPGATLLGVNRMLSDKEYRKKVVDNIKDPSVKTFWVEEFGKYTDKYAAEATPAIQNKIGQFTSNPLVRNLIGQPQSSFDIRRFMDERKILIINLSKGLVGEGNAKLIGSMLITKIYLAAMSRADKTDVELAKLPNFYLYVDEFQSFANKSFADILSEARKYKLSLNIAHQYVEQMEEEVRDAVFGNVGTMITFRVGALDAELLEKEFSPTFTAEDLVNLGFAQIYLKLMIDGISSQPFSAVTMAPIPKPEVVYKKQVIQISREQFGRRREEVEREINQWHEPLTPVKAPAPNSSFSGGRSGEGGFSGSGNTGNGQKAQYNDRNSRDMKREPPGTPVTTSPFERFNVRSESSPVREKSVQREVTPDNSVDQNKQAFIKATEILKEKIYKPEENMGQNETERKPKDFPPKIDNNFSLRDLSSNSEAKKNPSKENISSLKEALSAVINKPSQPKVDPKPARVEAKVIPPKLDPKPAEPIVETKKEEKKPEYKKTEEDTRPESGHKQREVPEEVLRQLLSMEE